MYWLVMSTFFWSASYGMYATKVECEESAKEAFLWQSAICLKAPEEKKQEEQKQ